MCEWIKQFHLQLTPSFRYLPQSFCRQKQLCLLVITNIVVSVQTAICQSVYVFNFNKNTRKINIVLHDFNIFAIPYYKLNIIATLIHSPFLAFSHLLFYNGVFRKFCSGMSTCGSADSQLSTHIRVMWPSRSTLKLYCLSVDVCVYLRRFVTGMPSLARK